MKSWHMKKVCFWQVNYCRLHYLSSELKGAEQVKAVFDKFISSTVVSEDFAESGTPMMCLFWWE